MESKIELIDRITQMLVDNDLIADKERSLLISKLQSNKLKEHDWNLFFETKIREENETE